MGNSSQQMEIRSTLQKNWVFDERQANVLVNRQTKEQVQRHLVKIVGKDLPKYVSHLANRMKNHHPNICRLLYFHQSPPDTSHSTNDNSLQDIFLYTDRMLPLQQWNKDILIIVLQALQTLINVYGPIRLMPKMICVNEIWEVKVWVSQNPVSSHPETRYKTEGQTLADLLGIVRNKNQDLANKIVGCHNFKDAIEKIKQIYGDGKPSSNNYSHRISEGEQFKFTKHEFRYKGSAQAYRNVFGDLTVQSQPKVSSTTPTKPKNAETTSPFPGRQEQPKPSSNISQYRDFQYINSAKKGLKEQRPTDRAITNTGMANDLSLEFKPQRNYQQQNRETTKTQFGKTDHISKVRSGDNLENKRSPLSFHRFQTQAVLGSPSGLNYHPAQKGFKATERKPFLVPETHVQAGKVNSFYNSAPNINRIEQPKAQSKLSPTPVPLVQSPSVSPSLVLVKKGSDDYLTRPKREVNGASKCEQRRKEKGSFVPVFLQQKKKSNNFSQDAQFVNKLDVDKVLTRQDTVDSNQSPFNVVETPNILKIERKSENNRDGAAMNPAKDRFKQLPEKSYNYETRNGDKKPIVTAQGSPTKYTFQTSALNSFYPKTPPPVIPANGDFTGFNSANSHFFENRVPLRTKTTQFYCKAKDKNEDNSQKKSLAIKQEVGPKSSHKPVQDHFSKTVGEDGRLHQCGGKQKKEEGEVVPEQKSNLKKKIRQEFNFLLESQGPAKEEPKSGEQKLSTSDLLTSMTSFQTRPEGEVKEKIIKKQMAFAELKKEAMKVLIGLD